MSDQSILSSMVKRIKNRDEDPLSPLVDKYLIDRHRSPRRLEQYNVPLAIRKRPPGRLSPSAIAGCMRQAAFGFVGVPGNIKVNPEREMVFVQGDWIHHKWAALLLDMEKVLGRKAFRVLSVEETIAIPDLLIAGTLDFTVWIGAYGKYVIDVKSINDRGFYYVVRQGVPKEEHSRQAMTYAKAKKLKKALILYENKNDQSFRADPIDRNPEIWEEIETWCEKVIDYLEHNELPPMHKDCEHGSFLWEKCPWSYLCFGRKKEEQIEEEMYLHFPGPDTAYERSVNGYQEER